MRAMVGVLRLCAAHLIPGMEALKRLAGRVFKRPRLPVAVEAILAFDCVFSCIWRRPTTDDALTFNSPLTASIISSSQVLFCCLGGFVDNQLTQSVIHPIVGPFLCVASSQLTRITHAYNNAQPSS